MTKYEVARTEEDAIKAVESFLRNGYDESEITVISKGKLQTDRFNDSQIQHKSTNATISDKFMRFFIGEDAEEAVLTRYNLEENAKDDLKQDISNNKVVVIGQKDNVKNGEVANNAAYQSQDKGLEHKHMPSEHTGDIE
ncbi:hypothetical protein DOS74_08370 [Staphylococcus felis]|uniref:General stress protein 17M-like domain-containing protein n=1 Tax=Staphylococcus felis TaxID=46127 RepID=A0AAX1RX02_9STAP|nr:general stress protein [Staphylococcus felis]REH77516.1 hypothetical protein DOS59_06830 [Staphylococcus felis]REH81768.1 hypothetical protein DOS63_11160 [Staphylococcus felis]REH82662.1 hypothetical protein DOS56_07570 [Staphylococcus felis]REI00504.1 hypothetical protein DOS64_05950 [Staphylococcus felis]REI14685.1 hypothetical protein DOS74_08370 [Staphylococcus felis]